ncbi:MAG: glutamate 5-kinase [Clostridiales bacterium]|jgi:glutamate 5-kinase|nr:glutamate 5-kinase [Clostridiales bacterium]
MDNRLKLKDKKRIVIKVGTTSLTYPNGRIDLKRVSNLAWVLTDLRSGGREVMLVSSGAIAVGAERLKLAERPAEVKGKQAASAVGQAILMQMYENFFMQYNQVIAQILLTKDVLEDETRKLNARNTFFTLFEMGVIPVVNENDTVSVEELGFSENDELSAYVACLTDADLLIILSDKDGLYAGGDPDVNPNSVLIDEVSEINGDIIALAGETKSKLGTGGMATKLVSAKMAVDNGIDVIMASNRDPSIIFKILDGEKHGTLFVS